jgi:hypothetical protein
LLKEVLHDTETDRPVILTSADTRLPFFPFSAFCLQSAGLALLISSPCDVVCLVAETMDTLGPLDPLAIHFENKFVTPPMLSKRANGTPERNSHPAQHSSRLKLATSVVVEGGANALPIARLQAAHSLRIKDLRPPASFYYSFSGFPQTFGKDPRLPFPVLSFSSCIYVFLFRSFVSIPQKDSAENMGNAFFSPSAAAHIPTVIQGSHGKLDSHLPSAI